MLTGNPAVKPSKCWSNSLELTRSHPNFGNTSKGTISESTSSFSKTDEYRWKPHKSSHDACFLASKNTNFAPAVKRGGLELPHGLKSTGLNGSVLPRTAAKLICLGFHWCSLIWGWVNTYRYIFRGMNIHKSQLFWCELQGYKVGVLLVLTHCHMGVS